MLVTLYDSQILLYTTNNNADATQIFELQNDRGKRLTDLEALKSFLMRGIYIHAVEDTEADLNIVQEDFASIYRSAEKIEGQPAAPNEDDLLAYHCIAFERWLTLGDGVDGWQRPKELVRRILATDARQDARTKTFWIRDFSRRLQDSFGYALQILDARDKCTPLGDLAALGRF